MIRSVLVVLAILLSTPASSETVNVKYRGVIDLTPFACSDTPPQQLHSARECQLTFVKDAGASFPVAFAGRSARIGR